MARSAGYNTADGRELIALFIDPATERFVFWTPDGYFDHDHPDEDGQAASFQAPAQPSVVQPSVGLPLMPPAAQRF